MTQASESKSEGDVASRQCPFPSRNAWHACSIDARKLREVAANENLGAVSLLQRPAFMLSVLFDAFQTIIHCSHILPKHIGMAELVLKRIFAERLGFGVATSAVFRRVDRYRGGYICGYIPWLYECCVQLPANGF